MGSVIPILQCNCVPVFADVDPQTGNMTADTIAAKITPRTRAVILVHLYGRPADLAPIRQLCGQHGIALIEDCSQAHLAEYNGRLIGTIGDFGCFSFQQTKQITCGDGGITLINRPGDAERAELYVDKGWVRHGAGRQHRFLGMNYRMTELQGAVAVAQLRRVDGLIAQRRRTADALVKRLTAVPGILLPPQTPSIKSSWWKFALGWDESNGVSMDIVFALLQCEGIKGSRTYLPRPLFEEEMLRDRNTYGCSHYPYREEHAQPCRADYPGLVEFDRRWINLPWSHRLTERNVEEIAWGVQRVARALTRGTHGRDRSPTSVAPAQSQLVSR